MTTLRIAIDDDRGHITRDSLFGPFEIVLAGLRQTTDQTSRGNLKEALRALVEIALRYLGPFEFSLLGNDLCQSAVDAAGNMAAGCWVEDELYVATLICVPPHRYFRWQSGSVRKGRRLLSCSMNDLLQAGRMEPLDAMGDKGLAEVIALAKGGDVQATKALRVAREVREVSRAHLERKIAALGIDEVRRLAAGGRATDD